jgi:surface protein
MSFSKQKSRKASQNSKWTHCNAFAGITRKMDCVTMVLVERKTVLPLDLVVLINSFLYEKLTDVNFKQAIALWFWKNEASRFRFGHISDWNTSRVTNMRDAFINRRKFNQDISRWNVSNVTDMGSMFSVLGSRRRC